MTKKLVLCMAACGIMGLSACTDSDPVNNCANGSKRCSDNTIQVCLDNAWKIETPCEGATLCDATSLTCELNTCSPNDSRRCNGIFIEICTDGTWHTQKQCATSEICNATSFTCEVAPVCTTDSKRCNGNAVEICINGAWSVETQCEGATLCNADSLTCKATTVTCDQGATRCNANGKLDTCQNKVWISSDCAAGQTCPSGKTVCETLVCSEGQVVCNDAKSGQKICVNNT